MNYKEILRNITGFVFDVDGVFTDGLVLAMPDGDLLRQHNSKDGYAVRRAVEQGYRVGIISGGASDSIRKRFEMLGVQDVYLGERNKIIPFNDFCSKYNLTPNEILAMGDDIPDMPLLRVAGCACCPADAVQEVKDAAAYISYQKGGRGCVRDVIEQTLRLQQKW
jgi:3-deoxy-D-manno-octulosonate 8-phosphate phosphatase (KDO 8-P phosphatase)